MTVQDGLLKLKHLRGAIETLRSRQEYLVAKIEEKWPDPDYRPAWSYEQAEVQALTMALDAMESEWDTVARMWRNVGLVELRYRNLENVGKEFDTKPAPDWTLDSAPSA